MSHITEVKTNSGISMLWNSRAQTWRRLHERSEDVQTYGRFVGDSRRASNSSTSAGMMPSEVRARHPPEGSSRR